MGAAESGELSPNQWRRVKEIFHEALEREPAQRTAFLHEACEGDAPLEQVIQSLLASDRCADEFLETPAAVRVKAAIPSSSRAEEAQRGLPDVGLSAAWGSPQYQETQALLRHRLPIIILIGFGTYGLFYVLRFLRLNFTPAIVWGTMFPGALYLASLLVTALILRRKQVYSLSRLRWFEGFAFGITTLYFLWDAYFTLFVDPGYLVAYIERHPAEMSIVARQPSIIWMVMIIGYGTFIPNTGRRCAVVSILMAMSPLILIASFGFGSSVLPPRLIALFLAEMTMWMSCGVAMAIYGSHKITVLREEAQAARKLGQYQLKRRLGKGGMGEVYLAEHVLLKRPCAVKVIRPEQAGDPTTLQRFLREVQVTATLTHPNTIQVFDYGQTNDGTVFYAMEYLAGLSLEELVSVHGSLPPERVIFVLSQLCGALAEAHAVGLIHRDIKPSNVILCSRGGLHDVAKLLDFGLVRMPSTDAVTAGLTQTGLIFGTPDYMSPEQAAGKKEVDARSDIYTLGALAYFLATGRPPFQHESVVETLAAHLNEPVAPLRRFRAGFPEDFETVVLRCLAKDPEERFSSVEDLSAALGACASAGEWTESKAAQWWDVQDGRLEIA